MSSTKPLPTPRRTRCPGPATPPADPERWGVHHEDPPPYNRLRGPVHPRGGVSGVIRVRGEEVASWGEPDRADLTFSVAKTYLALLAGIAQARGLLRRRASASPQRLPGIGFDDAHNRAITWAHLLEQTSEWQGACFGMPDQVEHDRRRCRTTPSRRRGRKGEARPLQAPGSYWEYNDVRINQLSLALLHLFRRPLPQVFRDSVLQPLGGGDDFRWDGYDDAWVEIDGRAHAVGARRHALGRRRVDQRARPGPHRPVAAGWRRASAGEQIAAARLGARACSSPCAIAPFYGWLVVAEPRGARCSPTPRARAGSWSARAATTSGWTRRTRPWWWCAGSTRRTARASCAGGSGAAALVANAPRAALRPGLILHLGPGIAFAVLAFGCDPSRPVLGLVCQGNALKVFLGLDVGLLAAARRGDCGDAPAASNRDRRARGQRLEGTVPTRLQEALDPGSLRQAPDGADHRAHLRLGRAAAVGGEAQRLVLELGPRERVVGIALGLVDAAVSVRPSVVSHRRPCRSSARDRRRRPPGRAPSAPCRGTRAPPGRGSAASNSASPARPCSAISASTVPIENLDWWTVCGSVTGPSTSIAPWCTCAVTRAMSSAVSRCSRIDRSSASAAGCVWRHDAWNLNEVSASAQRVPRPIGEPRRIGVASTCRPPCPAGLRGCGAAPVKPSRAR